MRQRVGFLPIEEALRPDITAEDPGTFQWLDLKASRCRFAADASVSVSWRWLKITDYPRSTEAEFVEAGGLLSYGPSLPDLFRRAAPLRGQNSQRSETGRVAGRAAQQVGPCSLRHDAFQLHLAGVLKYGLAVIEFQMTTFS